MLQFDSQELMADFIQENELKVKALIEKAKDILSSADFDDEDDYTLACCAKAAAGLWYDTDNIYDITVADDEMEEFLNFVHYVFTMQLIWQLENKGLAVFDEDTKTVRLTEAYH